MKEIVKEHPLRPIILRFDLTKKAPDFEKKGLEAYYRMHDSTWDMRTKLLQHKDELQRLQWRIDELGTLLLPMEHDLQLLEFAVKLRDPNHIPLPKTTGTFSISYSGFADQIRTHNEAIIAFYPELRAAWDWFDAHADFIYENESWIEEDVHILLHEIYQHYEEVSVDIVSLDRDEQEFYGAYAEVQKIQTDYFDYGNEVFKAYKALHSLATAIYHRAERVDERAWKDFEKIKPST